MSSSGHYTRYINQVNQYPGWSDNCDTMYKPVHSPLEGECRLCKWDNECNHDHRNCFCTIGHLTVEHTAGNKWAYCSFTWDHGDKYNYWQWIREQTDYIGPLKAGRSIILFEYSGKMAIQNILEKTKTINVWDLVDLMFKDEFYNRSYIDHFRYYQEVMENV